MVEDCIFAGNWNIDINIKHDFGVDSFSERQFHDVSIERDQLVVPDFFVYHGVTLGFS